MRAKAMEQALISKAWTSETIADTMAKLTQDFTPLSDMRASAEYRMKSAQGMLMRYFLEDIGLPARVLEVTS